MLTLLLFNYEHFSLATHCALSSTITSQSSPTNGPGISLYSSARLSYLTRDIYSSCSKPRVFRAQFAMDVKRPAEHWVALLMYVPTMITMI